MGCFVVAEFLLTTASRGPSAIAEPLVCIVVTNKKLKWLTQKFPPLPPKSTVLHVCTVGILYT